MKFSYSKWLAFMVVPVCVTLAVGCHREVAKAQPSVPAVSPAPTAAISANPASIQRGQSTTLTWQTSNATEVSVPGVGSVSASGSRSVVPDQSTTYELSAKGPGGVASASTRVTVNWQSSSSTPAEVSVGPQEIWAKRSRDIYFDYDRFNIRADQMDYLQTDAQLLKQYGQLRVNIEGHCDERGSEEYNLALGAKRADSVQNALQQLGVSGAQLQTISYGKERPFCDAHNEQCWQQNRRDHIASRQ